MSRGKGAAQPTPLCPSAQPDMPEAVVFGVVSEVNGRRQVAYLNQRIPLTEEVRRRCDPVKPAEVFRIAAPCAGSACQHFDGSRCRLVQRTVRLLAPVVDRLPACLIRPRCRWWREEGAAACLRCPQVVTDNWGAIAADVVAAATGPFSVLPTASSSSCKQE